MKSTKTTKIMSESDAKAFARTWVSLQEEEFSMSIVSRYKAQKLASALVAKRGKQGVTTKELEIVLKWAEGIEADYATLGCVLSGSMTIDVSGNRVKTDPNVYVGR